MKIITNDIIPSVWYKVFLENREQTQTRVSFPMAVYLCEKDYVETLPCVGPSQHEAQQVLFYHTQRTSRFYRANYAVQEEE